MFRSVLRSVIFIVFLSPFVLPSWVVAQSSTNERLERLEKELVAIREQLNRIEKHLLSAGEQNPTTLPPITSESKHDLELWIIPSGWDGGLPADILAVCNSAADSLLQHVVDTPRDPVILEQSTEEGPMTVYGKTVEGRRRVLLNCGGRYWSQYAFQFAHEVCHIACNYRSANEANLWFEESLCEAASLFTLREMGKSWQVKAPYPNWKSHAANLTSYAQNRIDATEKLGDQTLAQWYRQNQKALRSEPGNRQKNAVVAKALLALFEKHPTGWQAVRSLNQWEKDRELSFKEYLTDWYDRVDVKRKDFVKEIAALFEIEVKSP